MPKQVCACKDCKTKIKMIEVTLGTCRCDKVFCPKHRLPEAHDCPVIQRLDKEQFMEQNKCVALKIDAI